MNLRQLIKYIFRRDTTHHGEFMALWRLLPNDAPKVVVDVGANDGFYGSNSFPFVARNWQAILIEPHPEPFARLQKRFQNNRRVTCLNVACAESAGKRPLFLGRDSSLSTLCADSNSISQRGGDGRAIVVPMETLAGILDAHKTPSDFGVLSIDAEGMDYEVLLGLDFSRWRPRLIITEDYQPKEAGKSKLLSDHNYRLVRPIAGNTIWQSVR